MTKYLIILSYNTYFKIDHMTKNINQDYHPMWEKPKHHTRSTVKNSHVHWIELFYDLVHVVCIFLLGNLLSQNLTIE